MDIGCVALLFCRAEERDPECGRLRQILDEYARVSGQAINYAKSGVFFSNNVNEFDRANLRTILGI